MLTGKEKDMLFLGYVLGVVCTGVITVVIFLLMRASQ